MRPARGQLIDVFAHVVDAWLRAELLLKGAVIHERLVEQYGFTGNYQRVKLSAQARPRIAAELGISPDQLAGLHRRFEVVPGAQAQVDWGDEGGILAHVGIAKVTRFTWCCRTRGIRLLLHHQPGPCRVLRVSPACVRAFRRGPGGDRLRPDEDRGPPARRPRSGGAAASGSGRVAGHYDFDIDVLAAYRPTGKGRVERQVTIVRDHVLARRSPRWRSSMPRSWPGCRSGGPCGIAPTVRSSACGRSGTMPRCDRSRPGVCGRRPASAACRQGLPGRLRRQPLLRAARRVRHRQLVKIRATAATITIHATVPGLDGATLLATHQRAVGRGARVVDESHWDGLPDGHTRAVTTGDPPVGSRPHADRTAMQAARDRCKPCSRAAAAQIAVEARPLSVYEQIAQASPFTNRPHLKDVSK